MLRLSLYWLGRASDCRERKARGPDAEGEGGIGAGLGLDRAAISPDDLDNIGLVCAEVGGDRKTRGSDAERGTGIGAGLGWDGAAMVLVCAREDDGCAASLLRAGSEWGIGASVG